MSMETNPNGSFDAVEAMMGILDGDEPQPDTSEAEQDEEVVATDEVDDEADESDDEEGEVEEQQPEVRVFKVKVDGEEVEVPEDELLRGYSRTQDYTRKTQALAEQRKQAEQEYEAVRAERAQYAQLLDRLSSKLEAEPEVDESLQYTDPIAYAQQLSAYMQAQQQKQVIAQEQQRLSALEQQAQQQRMQKYLAEQSEALTTLIPDWVDPEVAKVEKVKVREAAKQYGYSDEELAQLYDARAVALMRDAMKYRELVAKRQEIKPKADPVVKSRPKAVTSDVSRAKQRLAKTGSVNDAAAIFMKMI